MIYVLGQQMLLLCNMMLITVFAKMIKKSKHCADRKMVKALDAVPLEWGHSLTRNTINTKRKLGLGQKSKKKPPKFS